MHYRNIPLCPSVHERAWQPQPMDKRLSSAELILREITNGTNYVCENENGEIIGTFCFIPGEDPTYARIDDGNWLNNEPYYVIHRMATNGKQKGVADACLKWCFEHCNNIR